LALAVSVKAFGLGLLLLLFFEEDVDGELVRETRPGARRCIEGRLGA